MRTTLTALVHGESGVGKSRLGGTAPAPRLILDSEGRAKYLPGTKVYWDPMVNPPPENDGSWETCVAHISDFNSMQHAYNWLRSGQHPFVSVVVDSLMEIQKRCIDDVAGVNPLQTQDWGMVLRRLESLVRSYRDLTLVPDNSTSVVVFIVGTKEVEGVRRPLLQGQLLLTVPYFVDVVGYYFVRNLEDGGGVQRELLVQPLPGFVAKDGTDRLGGPIIVNPDLTELFELLNIKEEARV